MLQASTIVQNIIAYSAPPNFAINVINRLLFWVWSVILRNSTTDKADANYNFWFIKSAKNDMVMVLLSSYFNSLILLFYLESSWQ